MNSSMTRMTENSKIFNTIILMTFIYVMNVQTFFRFAYKTFMRIVSKGSLPIISTSFSIIFIVFTRTFESMKCFLFTNVRTKFRSICSIFFSFVLSSTNLAFFTDFCISLFSVIKIAFSTAKTNLTTFTFRNIARPFKKIITTVLTCNFKFIIPRAFITKSRTINGSIFFKCVSTGWAYLNHIPSLSLATVKVNQEVSNGKEI